MKRKKKNMTMLDYMRTNVKWMMLFMALVFIAGIFIGPGFGSYGSLQCGKNKTTQLSREEQIEAASPVMAKLGDKEFKAYMIDRLMNQQMERYRQTNPNVFISPEDMIRFQYSILDGQIEDELKLRKAAEAGIKLDQEEVNKEYLNQKKTIMQNLQLLPPAGDTTTLSLAQRADLKVKAEKAERAFLGYLTNMGQSPEKLRKSIEDRMLIQKYDEKLTEDAKKEVKEAAKKIAIGYYNDVVSGGKDFAQVAKANSKDPGSAAKGGLVENMTRKDAKAKGDEFATKLFTGELNKVLEPIETESGFYVVKIESRTLAQGPEYEAAKPGITAELKKELGITDKSEPIKPDVKNYTEEEKQKMAQTAGVEGDTSKEAPKEEKKITDDMIAERYEKVTFRQIFVQPESYYEKMQANLAEMKKTAGIEIIDPMMKIASLVSSPTGDNNYDSALEQLRALREEKTSKMNEAIAENQKAEEEAKNATDDKTSTALEKSSDTLQKVDFAKTELAQVDYLIAYYNEAKIKDINQKRIDEFQKKMSANVTPNVAQTPPGIPGISGTPVNQTVPEASAEEQAQFAQWREESRKMIEEAIALNETPEPYFSALYGDLLLIAREWDKAHDNWAIVADYGSRDLALLERAEPAYNQFMDKITDPAKRAMTGQEFDKLQKDLLAARQVQQKQQEEWQKQMQKMIEEQTAQQNTDKTSSDATDGGTAQKSGG